MAAITAEAVREALEGVKYPGFTRNIVSFGLVQDIQVAESGDVAVVIEHTIDDERIVERIRRDAEPAVEALDGVGRVDLPCAARATGREARRRPRPWAHPRVCPA